MNKLLLIVIFILYYNFGNSYSKRCNFTYTGKIAETGCIMELRLGENGIYNLIIIQKMHVSLLTPLSIGYYHINKDTFYFRDSAASTTFIGIMKKKELSFLTGYPIMKSQKLKYNTHKTNDVIFFNLIVPSDTICNEDTKKIQSENFEAIEAGRFQFKSDNTYEVYCTYCASGEPFVITRGKYVQRDCMLYLYDSYVKKMYRMMLKSNQLINLDVPYNPGPYFLLRE